MLMLRKRWLLPLISIVLAVVVSAFYFSSSGNPVVSKTTFTNVNRNNLLWSGQNEGETVRVVPNHQQSVGGIFIPPFNRYSLSEGVAQAERQGIVPLVPTLLPEGMVYADVYIGPTVDVCFSYKKANDPSYADFVIEMHGVPTVPSINDLKDHPSPGTQVFQAGDKWVEIFNDYYHDQETGLWAIGKFFHGNVQYMVSAKYPLTNQDLIIIIGNMKTPS